MDEKRNMEFKISNGAKYEKFLDKRKSCDYQIDQTGMYVQLQTMYFLEKQGGVIEPVQLISWLEHGGATAYFDHFAVRRVDLIRAMAVIDRITALSIDCMTDNRICISMNIRNVFRKENASK